MVDTASGSLIGVICHTRARSEGGPRYVAGLSEVQKHASANLILLCGAHHKVVDDHPDEYPIERLEEMKAEHESRVRPLDREQLFAVLAALAPPAVPADWWRRPGAPIFLLHLSSSRPSSGAWTFTAEIEQQFGTHISRPSGRFAGDMAETELADLDLVRGKWRIPDWRPAPRSERTIDRDRAIGLGASEFAIELRFWWDGDERRVLFVWRNLEDFQNERWQLRHG